MAAIAEPTQGATEGPTPSIAFLTSAQESQPSARRSLARATPLERVADDAWRLLVQDSAHASDESTARPSLTLQETRIEDEAIETAFAELAPEGEGDGIATTVKAIL